MDACHMPQGVINFPLYWSIITKMYIANLDGNIEVGIAYAITLVVSAWVFIEPKLSPHFSFNINITT